MAKIFTCHHQKIVADLARVAISAIASIYQVRSGMAIECVSDALREWVLGSATSLQKDGIILEAASDWKSVIVLNMFLHIRTQNGNILVTNEMVMAECQSVTPAQVRANKAKLGQFYTNWIIHFKQKPGNYDFRLFDESGPAIPFTRRHPFEKCRRF